jgi:hypothetical protein
VVHVSTAVQALKLTARKLEAWENGFNVIAKLNGVDPLTVGKVLDLSAEGLATFSDADPLAPVARVETEKAAQLVVERLAASGVECAVVADTELSVERPLTRLRGLEIDAQHIRLIPFNSGVPVTEKGSSNVGLIVKGTVVTSKTDSLEKRKRNGTIKVLDESSVASDAAVMDLYLRGEATGFRIYTTGFDFSCLGEEKGMIASENMRLLIKRVTDAVPSVILVNNYDRIRYLIDRVWPIEARKDSQGFVRSGFGRKELGVSQSTNNLEQFTKYSRLQRHLL